jgi:hypothetical protein
VASNFACIGFPAERVEDLVPVVEMALPASRWLGRHAGVDVRRWEDPSGARLVMMLRGRTVEGLLPSFAGTPGVGIGNVSRASNGTCMADVAGNGESPMMRLSLELEEGPLLRESVSGKASLVAFASAVKLHPTVAAFTAARESLIDPDQGDDDSATSPHARMAAESFFPLGLFAAPDDIHARAILNGIVLYSRRLTNAATGVSFTVARVKCIGIELDVCLAEAEHPVVPTPGQVVGGDVFMVGSLATPPAISRLEAARHAVIVRIKSLLSDRTSS